MRFVGNKRNRGWRDKLKRLISRSGLVATTLIASTPLFFSPLAAADSVSVNFEPNTYQIGDINNQDGWVKTGPYDAAVVANNFGFSSFGTQSLRISNGVTSGSFGDQTFAKPLTNAVGEADSTASTYSTGTLQREFIMQFDIASTSSVVQPGQVTSVSPDRGDGSRMSYLRFEDQADGIHVIFDDVEGTANPANFVDYDVATLSRSTTHTIKMKVDLIDGPSNDKVYVWVDGNLVKTGTSWENYYRYDSESSAEQTPRIIRTVLFREGGTAVPANQGHGFLFDNFSESSGPVTPNVNQPTNKDQCKDNGYKNYTDNNGNAFKNQGLCVSYANGRNDNGNNQSFTIKGLQF